MAETANNPLPVGDEDQFQEETLSERFMDWVRTELVWYAGSFSFHLLALSVLLLLPNFGRQDNQGDAPVLESKADEADKKDFNLDKDKYDIRRARRNAARQNWISTPHLETPGHAGPGGGI